MATKTNMERRTVNRQVEARVLVVCEGEETERKYFNGLIESMRLVGIDVTISTECGSAPINVVEHAIRLIRKEGETGLSSYDKVFCVFDRDSHESFQRAKSLILTINKSEKIDIRGIISNPCIEFWFILHHRYTRAAFTATGNKSNGDKAVDHLKTIDGYADYKKSLSAGHITLLINKTEIAIVNSKLAWQDSIQTSEENPSTNMFELIEYLKEKQQISKIEREKSLIDQ